MMGLRVDDDDDRSDPRSTPKLSLSNLPCKPKQFPIQIMLTPPLHPSLSIPFHWEEAPGKPRLSADEAAATRCLDLPPKLSHDDGDEEVTMMPSPATVLGGPYVARSMSLACTFSFRKGPSKKTKMKKGGCGSFGRSRRWRSFKFREEEEEEEMSSGGGGGSFDFSQTLGDIFKREKNGKNSGIRRVGSFFDFSTINSNLLDIYARFKQAIPWRRTK